MLGDPTKIFEQLGWAAEIPLSTTLADILREIDKNEL
jgi:nucleoside-diphosphate-sugar epimerase